MSSLSNHRRLEESENSLSLKAGLNRNAVGQILSGRARNPRLDTVRSLGHATRVHPSLLIDD